MRLAATIVALVVAGGASAADQGFLFDLLQQKTFRAGWDKLMKSVDPTPDWLTEFNKNFDGVSGAVETVTVDGKAYDESFVCKPQDCSGHRFAVIFEPNGARAYGALGGKGGAPAFFGDPPQSLQDALAKIVGG